MIFLSYFLNENIFRSLRSFDCILPSVKNPACNTTLPTPVTFLYFWLRYIINSQLPKCTKTRVKSHTPWDELDVGKGRHCRGGTGLRSMSTAWGIDAPVSTRPNIQSFPHDKGAITSKIKHAIKLKTSSAKLAQLLHNCFNPH